MELGRVLKEIQRSLSEVENNAEAIPAALLKFQRALKLARVDQLVEKVKSELEQMEQRGEDVEDMRVRVLYRGKVDLVSHSRNGLLALTALTVKDFAKAIEETKKLIMEGSDLDPFDLLKGVTAAKISPLHKLKASNKQGGS